VSPLHDDGFWETAPALPAAPGIKQDHRRAGVATDAVNREADDFYPTPPVAVHALLKVEHFDGPIWEPACGDGAISNVLANAGHSVFSSDLVDRGYGIPRVDFLLELKPLAPNIVTNPPFKIADLFMRHACHLAERKVALLLRLACLEGAERKRIYAWTPLARVWVFSRRLSIWRGRQATDEDSSGMFAMAWFVWDKHKAEGPPTLGWL
jgi:hypothetical protein